MTNGIRIQLLSVFFSFFILCGSLQAEKNYPPKIRGYKVFEVSTAAASDADMDMKGLIKLEGVDLGPLSFERLNLEIPVKVNPVPLGGTIDLLVFDEMFINGIPFSVKEYSTPFDIPTEESLILPAPLELQVKYSSVAKAALSTLLAPRQSLTVSGNVLVFGRFEKFLLTFKRVVPVSFSVNRENPLVEYNPLKRIALEAPAQPEGSQQTGYKVERPWYVTVDPERVAEIADHWAEEIRTEYGTVEDPIIEQYLNNLTSKFAGESGRSDIQYQVEVIEKYEYPNTTAFTVGNGHIFIVLAALEEMTTEGELAFTLAHEIGHNAAYHADLQIQRQILGNRTINSLSDKVPEGKVSSLVDKYLGRASKFVQLQFARSDEKEADIIALHILCRTGYDPHIMLKWGEPGDRSFVDWIDGLENSHPSPEERYAYFSREVEDLEIAEIPITNTPEFDAIQKHLSLPAPY